MKIIELNSNNIVSIIRGRLDILKSDGHFNRALLLSEEDLVKDNLPCSIKGYSFVMVLIPKSMEELFENDTEIRPIILAQLKEGGRIEYF